MNDKKVLKERHAVGSIKTSPKPRRRTDCAKRSGRAQAGDDGREKILVAAQLVDGLLDRREGGDHDAQPSGHAEGFGDAAV